MDIWENCISGRGNSKFKGPETGQFALSAGGPAERQLLLVGNWQAIGGDVRITGDWKTGGCGGDYKDSG